MIGDATTMAEQPSTPKDDATNGDGPHPHRISPRIRKSESRDQLTQPELPVVEKVNKVISTDGVSVVQFRTVPRSPLGHGGDTL
jgi:hypothetical protein